jgi:hypothetical protein
MISQNEIEKIDKRFEVLYDCCNKMEPVASSINELEVEFTNREYSHGFFDIISFRQKLDKIERIVTDYFNRMGVDRLKITTGLYFDRMLYEVHNTTKFEIRYFTCMELANPFIKENKNNDAFQLAKVFYPHRQIVHTPFFN